MTGRKGPLVLFQARERALLCLTRNAMSRNAACFAARTARMERNAQRAAGMARVGLLATEALRAPDERPHVCREAADAGHLRGLDSNWPRTLIELGNGDALNREHQPTINRIVRNLRAGRN